MILRFVFAASILALQASSFLIPLEISNEVETAKAQLESLWTNKANTIDLSCPGCTFLGPEKEGLEYNDKDENTIVSAIESAAIRVIPSQLTFESRN